MSIPTAPEELLKRIRGYQHLLVTSHANPDGDAIGTELGIARLLRSMGKGVTIWNADPLPTVYQPLPGSDRIHVGQEPPQGYPDHFDAVVVLECPAMERTGLTELSDPVELSDLPKLNIDHHLGNQHYGVVNWVDTSAPAVGEMVFHLAKGLKVGLDRDTATCLYLALVSDTGCFRFSNASPRAFQAAAALVAEGASPEQVAGWLYESRPLGMMRLLSSMLETLELHTDGRVATAHLTEEMYRQAGASHTDAEGLIDYPRSLAGVDAVALFRQLDSASYKVSLRSRADTVNVERIARAYGGGGHRNAAGLTLSGTYEQVRERVLADLDAALRSES